MDLQTICTAMSILKYSYALKALNELRKTPRPHPSKGTNIQQKMENN